MIKADKLKSLLRKYAALTGLNLKWCYVVTLRYATYIFFELSEWRPKSHDIWQLTIDNYEYLNSENTKIHRTFHFGPGV